MTIEEFGNAFKASVPVEKRDIISDGGEGLGLFNPDYEYEDGDSTIINNWWRFLFNDLRRRPADATGNFENWSRHLVCDDELGRRRARLFDAGWEPESIVATDTNDIQAVHPITGHNLGGLEAICSSG